MEKISVFECLDKSSRPSSEFTIEETLQYIKDNPRKELITDCKFHPDLGGKMNSIMKFKDRIWDQKEQRLKIVERNYYNHVKQKKAAVVTWNCFVTEKRAKDKIQAPSGYIYCDVDDFKKLILSNKVTDEKTAKEYVKKLLSSDSLGFIKAVWDSFGGDGLGFLVKVSGLTVSNFTTTWKTLESLFSGWNITIDPSTKDITRCNVLPYDPSIFIREDENVVPFDAVEPKENNTVVFDSGALPKELTNDTLAYKLDNLYNTDKSWSNNRLTYNFFFEYFAFCNLMGIEKEDAINFLIRNNERYPLLFSYRSLDTVKDEIADRVTNYYGDQFGKRLVSSNDDGNTIYELNKKYSGDVTMKIEYVWSNIKHKALDKNIKIRSLAKISKEAGIFKKPVIDFLEAILDFDEDLYKTVNQVYGDSNILFGAIKILTDDAANKKKQDYYNWAASNSMEVKELTEYKGDLPKKLDEILKEANNIFQAISRENVFQFIGYYFKNAKAFAVKRSDSLEYIKNLIADNNIEESIKIDTKIISSEKKAFLKRLTALCEFVSFEIYDYDSWKFGLRTLKRLTSEKMSSRFNISKQYFLKNGEYINSVGISDGDNQLIWGNTGQGKTTWICEHTKGLRLFLVPIIPLLLGIDNTYKASVYYRDKKNVQEGDELIVCTYSSFPNLLKQMKNWENVKISDYNLYMDEAHNFAVSSSQEFRGFELNCIVDNMHLFKSRKFLTGTNFPVLHPELKNVEVIRVNWEQTPVKICTPVRYNNILYAVENKLSKGGKNLIYLQNKKEEGQLGSLIDYLELKGWNKDKIWLINADEKHSENFESLMKDKRVKDDVEIVICTSVIIEGVDINNYDFKSVHFMTPESATNMEQMVNRLRNVYTKAINPDAMIYTYRNIDAVEDLDSDHVDVLDVQKKLIEQAERGLELMSKAYSSGDSISYKSGVKVFNQHLFNKSNLYRNKDGIWDIDYLSIANMAYNDEKRYSQKNIEFLKVLLAEYNWKFEEELLILEDMQPEELNRIKTLKAERKETLTQDVLDILEEVKLEGEEEACSKVSDEIVMELEKLPRGQYHISIRSKVRYLTNHMSFEDACSLMEEWILDHNMSDRIWNKVIRQINVKLTEKLKTFDNAKDNSTVFAKELLKSYKKVKVLEKKIGSFVKLTLVQVIDFINKAKHKAGEEILDEKQSLLTFKSYFDTEEFLDVNGAYYVLTGIKLINEISSFNGKLKSWAELAFKKGETLTNEELAAKLNKFRGDLPILSMYKLDSRNAMRLIHDYYTFERAGVKTVKGKKTNTYKFIDLDAKEISKYEIIPLRKVSIDSKHYEDMTIEELEQYQLGETINNLNYYLAVNQKPDEFLLEV